MSQMPTKAELDRRLGAASRAIKTMDQAAARTHCAAERSWMEAHWHPAVAKAAVEKLRAEFKKRFRH